MSVGERNKVAMVAQSDVLGIVEDYIAGAGAQYSLAFGGQSYQGCLEPAVQHRISLFILQAQSPITAVDDLLYDLVNAGLTPAYVLFQITAPGKLRFAATTSAHPEAQALTALFLSALEGHYDCERVSFRSTLLSDDSGPGLEAAGRHESLLEILRGCDAQEFAQYKERYRLDLRDQGCRLFFWELMGVEFADHELNKYIYNFSGEMLLRECTEIIVQFQGGEVFYSSPNLLCIILNEVHGSGIYERTTKFEELIAKLAHCTGNKIARRYLSAPIQNAKGLRAAYERYHSEKSLSFFLRDMRVIRPELIDAQKRHLEMKDVNELLQRISEYIRYDLLNQALDGCLNQLYFQMLKPAMSFTLYYSSTAAVYSVIAEVQFTMSNVLPVVNNNPYLLQYSSIEEQYSILVERIRELRAGVAKLRKIGSPAVLKAVDYIKDNYQKDLTVTDIASALYFSSVHLSQVFKREMGTSLLKYLIGYRINMARWRLRETEDFIYTISEDVGFRDFRHFSRTFKELTGLSPTEYRRQYRG